MNKEYIKYFKDNGYSMVLFFYYLGGIKVVKTMTAFNKPYYDTYTRLVHPLMFLVTLIMSIIAFPATMFVNHSVQEILYEYWIKDSRWW